MYTCKWNFISRNTAPKDAFANNSNEEVVFKHFAPFTDYIFETKNTQVDNSKDIDMVILMYNLIEYSHNYLKASLGLWQYYRNEPFLDNNYNIIHFTGANHNRKSFK